MIKTGLALLTRKPDFGWLMGAQFLALAGDGLVQTALAKLIVFGNQKGFDLEGAKSPDELLRIALFLMIPYSVVSPFLGVVIDRWDRRRLLVLANALRAVVMLLVALAGTARVGDLALFLAFILTLMSTRVVLATKAAALPVALDEASLVEGNAVSQLGGAVFQLAGVAVALVAARFLSVEPIVGAGAIVYGMGAASASFLRHAGEARSSATFTQEVSRVVRNIAAGVSEVARVPKAAASITTYFWLRLLWSFSLVGIGFVARELLAGNDLVVAALTGGSGALGAVLGFVLAGRLNDRTQTTAHLVLASSAVAGLSVAVLGALQTEVGLALLAFGLGLGFFVAKVSLDTMVQEALGDDFRGRAFSLYDIAYNLAWVVAAAGMKAFWSQDVQGALIATMGGVFLIGLACLGAWFRSAGLLTSSEVREEARL